MVHTDETFEVGDLVKSNQLDERTFTYDGDGNFAKGHVWRVDSLGIIVNKRPKSNNISRGFVVLWDGKERIMGAQYFDLFRR